MLPSKQDTTLELSGVGGSGDTFTTYDGGGGPAKGTRKTTSEVAMGLDTPDQYDVEDADAFEPDEVDENPASDPGPSRCCLSFSFN